MTASGAHMLRLGGGALLLGGGAIHVLLSFDGYGTSTLQDMFLINAIGSAVVALLLLAVPGPLPALGGVGVAGASLLALALSRVGDGVVGFRGTGFDPMPEVPLTIAFEVAALAVLTAAALRERGPLVELLRSVRTA